MCREGAGRETAPRGAGRSGAGHAVSLCRGCRGPESSIRYRKSALLLPELGRELGAAYLLTATVRWDKREAGADRVRVSPELVEAATGATLWQQPFDAEMSDVFDVQTQIATRVAQALDLALATGDRERLDRRPTSDVTAYEAYLEGNAATDGMVSQVPVDLREAAAHYGRAVALDPEFALAWAQLSRVHSQLYSYGGLAPNDRDQARRAAERALVLAPALGVAHLALGNYFDLIEQNWQKALEQYALGRQGEPRNVELLSAAAQAQQRLGLWQESVATLELARSLDPRSAVAARNLARVLLRLRRYDDARAAVEDGLRLAPHSLDLLEFKAMVALARGDLKTARSVVANAAREQGQAAVVAYFATYWDLFWVLDSDQQELLLELSPEAFDNDRMSWAITHAEVAALRGDAAKTRLYAEAARAAADEQLASAPNDAQRHAFLGLALAYLGRTTDAVREGERAVALMPVTRDASAGAYLQHQLARIYVLAGEHEKGIDTLERLLAIPYFVSPAWLRIDPAFAALLGHPRFERLSRANGG